MSSAVAIGALRTLAAEDLSPALYYCAYGHVRELIPLEPGVDDRAIHEMLRQDNRTEEYVCQK
jgi:hypothetical protein